MEKEMSVLKFARSAAALAALTLLPAHAIAAAPATLPVLAASVAAQDAPATADDEGQPFFQSEYFVPTLIVIVLAIGFYFLLSEDEDETPGPPVSA
jgi:hypothetical protein